MSDDAGRSTRGHAPPLTSTRRTTDRMTRPFEPMDHAIVVKLLGGVEVTDRDGAPGQFERSKTVELIAWLATHRTHSTRGAAARHLWELDVRDATFANVVSEARRALGRLVPPPPGEEWLARTLTEQLPLHPWVVTDAQLIEERLEQARLEPPSRAIDTLRPAVEMVTGMPFADTSYLWPDAEGITSKLVLLAISASAELAGHALSIGDTELVFWATGRGLAVLPGHEELIALRMRAHARSGDLRSVRQEWETLRTGHRRRPMVGRRASTEAPGPSSGVADQRQRVTLSSVNQLARSTSPSTETSWSTDCPLRRPTATSVISAVVPVSPATAGSLVRISSPLN